MEVKCFSGENCSGCALARLGPDTKRRLGFAVNQAVAEHIEEVAVLQSQRDGGDEQANIVRARAEEWLWDLQRNRGRSMGVIIAPLDSHEIALGATAIRRGIVGECSAVA